MSKRSIITYIVAGTAVILLVLVILLKTNVIGADRSITDSTTVPETETSVVVVSQVNEDGDMEYLTFVTSYIKPSVSSNYRYPTTVPRSTSATSTGPQFTEVTKVEYLYDEHGNNLLDENGKPMTTVVTMTELVTAPPTTTQYVEQTSIIYETNVLGKPKKDGDGNPVTSISVLNPTGEVTTKKKLPDITLSYSRDEGSESGIISTINDARTAAGLPPLANDVTLKATARTIALNKAIPAMGGSTSTNEGQLYTLYNIGGTDVPAAVMAGSIGKGPALSADYTKIGVGVVKYEDALYTAIIFS